MFVISRYILNNIASLTMDCAVLKQTLNKKRLRKILTVHTIVKKYCVIIAKAGSKMAGWRSSVSSKYLSLGMYVPYSVGSRARVVRACALREGVCLVTM